MLDRHMKELTTGRYIVNREIELRAKGEALDKGSMTLGRRIEERRLAIGISQAELARRVGIRQSTMNSLINGDSRSSRSIVQIARELKTTAAYLIGDTDDPSAGAPQPQPVPRTQFVMMPVGMPSVEALADMFEGQLRVFATLTGAELALALAKRLPRALARLQAAELYDDLDQTIDDGEAAPPAPLDRPVARRSQRR